MAAPSACSLFCFFFLAFVSCYLALLAVFLGDLFREPKAAKILISARCNQAGTCTHKQRERERKIKYQPVSIKGDNEQQRYLAEACLRTQTHTHRWASEVIRDHFHYLRCSCSTICQLASDSPSAGKDEGGINNHRELQHTVVFMINATR